MKPSKKLYLGTNTKMYQTIADTSAYLSRLKELTCDISPQLLELFVLPSFTALEAAAKVAKNSIIRIGAQNMCWADEGPFTGEISPVMLREVGAELVMIGHSERRQLFRESDEDAARKISKALEQNFTALLCIGETRQEKEDGRSDEVLRSQLQRALGTGAPILRGRLRIAYEPVWAIGADGIAADEHYANERHRTIKGTLKELFGEAAGYEIPVLYGGSVTPEHTDRLMRMPEIDGLFIGRSAWDAERFNRIIRSALQLFYERGEKEDFNYDCR